MMTPLDQAHAAMAGGREADALRFYRVLADATLFLLLDHEGTGERINPKVFDLPDGPVLLAFDSEDRMAEFGQGTFGQGAFGQGAMPYAALPGRIVAQHLAGKGVALGLNFGSGSASETLLPPEAMSWLAEMLEQVPDAVEARAEVFSAPSALPGVLDTALRETLAAAAGLARAAVLVGVRYAGGGRGHVLAIVDAHPGAQDALARAVGETLVFSGVEAGVIDVTFVAAADKALAQMQRFGRVFEIPEPEMPARPAPAAPGMDPDRPPRLR